MKRIDLMENLELPAGDAGESEILQEVLSLPHKYKAVIYLYYYQEYTVPQMAELLQRSENTIYSQLHRARELMRQRLEEKDMKERFKSALDRIGADEALVSRTETRLRTDFAWNQAPSKVVKGG